MLQLTACASNFFLFWDLSLNSLSFSLILIKYLRGLRRILDWKDKKATKPKQCYAMHDNDSFRSKPSKVKLQTKTNIQFQNAITMLQLYSKCWKLNVVLETIEYFIRKYIYQFHIGHCYSNHRGDPGFDSDSVQK